MGEGSGDSTSEHNTKDATCRFFNISTITTRENISLRDQINSLEYKLDKLLSKPSYASALQQVSPPCDKATSSAHIRYCVSTHDT